MKKVVLKAYGKVNLGLDVVRRRDDGYHEVRMIMQTVGLFDRLELKKTSGDSVTLSANLRFLPVNEQNLVCQACSRKEKVFNQKRRGSVSGKAYPYRRRHGGRKL